MHEELKRTEFVKKSKGRPANNNDPYPVDQKIQQLQSHEPFCKIQSIDYVTPYPGCINPVAQRLIGLSHNVEQRLCALENILATAVRYLYRTASRMQINCVYYGGQETLEKYSSIRCLHDDRKDDGQLVSLDQCLVCTRYEPVYGKVYEILDEAGLNAQQFMDDWQMAYLTQEDYLFFSCVEKMNEGRPMANCLEDLLPAFSFQDLWPDGFEMDWSFTPAEHQVSDTKEDS